MCSVMGGEDVSERESLSRSLPSLSLSSTIRALTPVRSVVNGNEVDREKTEREQTELSHWASNKAIKTLCYCV